jgi:hypothetical protein
MMHPPSSSPAAKDTTAAKCIGTDRYKYHQIPLNVLQSWLPILDMDLSTVVSTSPQCYLVFQIDRHGS